jgi:hypothetical protein
MRSALLIGLGAGLVSVIVAISAVRGASAQQVVMTMLSPVPLLIAGLGWGWVPALAGGLLGTALLAISVGLGAGISFAIKVAAPATLASYLIYLARDRRDGQGIDWFPIGSVVAALGLWGAAVPLFMLQLVGGSFDALHQPLMEISKRFFAVASSESGLQPPSAEILEAAVTAIIAAMPFAMACTWTVMFAFGLFLAARVIKMAGIGDRPWPDLTQITLPKEVPVVFAAAVATALALPGVTRVISTAAIGGLLVAFMMVGLATLHTIARQGKRWLLWLTYAGMLLLWPIVGLVLAVIGLADPVLKIRERHASPPSAPST